jgi:Putative MetA-pathway of phenol degradation
MIKLNLPSVPLVAVALSLATGVLSAAEHTTLPTVIVTAPATDSILDPDTLVGPYNQPEWTEHRRFPFTRVFLQKEPWEIGVEQWWRARTYDGKPTAHRFIEEFEIGLPHRLQLDLYYNWAHTDRTTHFDEFAVELRWALADWGQIPFNPTLYIEYAFVNSDYGGDTLESKILFGDTIGKNWQWGLNLIFESEVSHELAKEFAVAGGIGYNFTPSFSAGLEFQWKHETVAGQRSNPEIQFEIGPSVQWRLSKSTHLDLVALFGTTKDGPRVESLLVFGYDFGGGASKADSHYTPTTGKRF